MRRNQGNKPARPQSGYALLLIMFFLAALTVSLLAARANVITENRREKEQEMVWRGRQYVRGIRLYYSKTNHFPAQLEDLYQPKTGIRFMRQAYKDPMNTVDGSWRLIYVGPHGEIIGSLNQPPLPAIVNNPIAASNGLTGVLATPQQTLFGSTKTPFPNPGTNNSVSFSSFTASGSQASFANPGAAAPRAPNAATTPQTAQSGPQDPASDSTDGPSNPVFGGKIIGVGSKVDEGSLMWLEGAKNYKHFEFIMKRVTINPELVTPNP